jgi:hypothetical protein
MEQIMLASFLPEFLTRFLEVMGYATLIIVLVAYWIFIKLNRQSSSNMRYVIFANQSKDLAEILFPFSIILITCFSRSLVNGVVEIFSWLN